MDSGWEITIVHATILGNSFQFTSKHYPDVRIEVRAPDENEAWKKFKTIFKIGVNKLGD